jgi:hypothetical protein
VLLTGDACRLSSALLDQSHLQSQLVACAVAVCRQLGKAGRQRRRPRIASVGTNSMGYPQPMIIKIETIKPQQKAARLDRVQGPPRTRPARQGASTALQLRLVRGTPDGNASTAPRPAQTRHFDCAPSRTRLVRPPANLRLARPRVGALDPLHSPTLRQKTEHLMRLPATIYRHGYNCDRCGNNADVSPHCFTAHPVMGGETCHCAHLTTHCLSPITLEEGYDKVRTPRSRGFGLIRPTST